VTTERPRDLGIGIVYTPQIARVLDLGLVDVLEIEPQMFWHATGEPDDPVHLDLELFAELRVLPHHKLVHSVTLPVGNSRPHDQRALELLKRSVVALDAPYVSEHLSFNQFDAEAGRLWTGFLLPPKQDWAGVQNAAARIDEMRRVLGVPIAFETGVNYLRPQPDDLSDGNFWRSVAEAADCGILLDVHNLLTNERNGRGSVKAAFDEIPTERVWEIHLAGGREYRGYWLDSHSTHIEDELFSIARAIVGRCPNLRAIVFEIMGEYVDARSGNALCGDVQRLRSLWDERPRSRTISARQSPPAGATEADAMESPSQPAGPATARRREDTLGALVLGHVPHDPEPSIIGDPAASLYADLVASMREGVLYQVLPFVIRLMFVSIGKQATMDIISTFGRNEPPEPFGADEAQHFISYVRTTGLRVPHLAELLDFEEALIAVGRKHEARTVTFDCDTGILLEVLTAGQNPGALPRERFYVDISPDGINIRNAERRSFTASHAEGTDPSAPTRSRG
jgi:uncharacterized protein